MIEITLSVTMSEGTIDEDNVFYRRRSIKDGCDSEEFGYLLHSALEATGVPRPLAVLAEAAMIFDSEDERTFKNELPFIDAAKTLLRKIKENDAT